MTLDSYTKIALIFMRPIIDALALFVAYYMWRQKQRLLEASFKVATHLTPSMLDHEGTASNSKSRESERLETGLISTGKCEISYFRLTLRLEHGFEAPRASAYIEIVGTGSYEMLAIGLPFYIAIDPSLDESEGYSISLNTRRNVLLMSDRRPACEAEGTFRLHKYLSISLPITSSASTLLVSISWSTGPFAKGIPHSELRAIPRIGAEERGESPFTSPVVQKAELSISILSGSYIIDPYGLAPSPAFYNATSCTWISGANQGASAHSSISARLINPEKDSQLQVHRIRDGIGIGVWSAVFITVLLDLLWSYIDLVRTVAN